MKNELSIELLNAIKNGEHERIDFLIKKGHSMYSLCSVPALLAVDMNDKRTIDIFLNNGFDILTDDSTVYSQCIKNNNVEFFDHLVGIKTPTIPIIASANNSDNIDFKIRVNSIFGVNLIKA